MRLIIPPDLGGDRLNKKIGFIGAGKVGFSLGKYLVENYQNVSGYYSRNYDSARQAAAFTNTGVYEKLEHIVEDCDIFFLTVPDGEIVKVWEEIKLLSIEKKIFCHCSGSFASTIFSEISQCKAFGYSIHPLFAIHSKCNSYKELSQAFFTIEGSQEYLNFMKQMFLGFGNSVQIIAAQDKVKYHAAAVFTSNFVVALAECGQNLLCQCGFDKEQAIQALAPLMQNNVNHIIENGVTSSLTGPVERNDVETIRKHLQALNGENKEIYKHLSKILVKIGKDKNRDFNYSEMENQLDEVE